MRRRIVFLKLGSIINRLTVKEGDGGGKGNAPAKKLVFPSRMEDARRVLGEILEDVRAQGYDGDAYFAIRLSLDEALTNAVRHGNGCESEKTVTVEYTIDQEEFRISVTDQGPGFQPHHVPDPTCDENLERPSGRGVMLMKAYMTRVDYNDAGNRVTLVKRRDCRLPRKADDEADTQTHLPRTG